jgi:chromosome segregation ATPase
MKLQIDQIEQFEHWLTQSEQRITSNLTTIDEDIVGVERQYRQLAHVQDELVAQQQITESLQNMVIIIDDASTEYIESKYSSNDIESKLSNLSERWAHMCTFVQSRWVQLQEIKIELEQNENNRDKIHRWLTRKEDDMSKIDIESTSIDSDVLMQHVHWIKVSLSFVFDT